MNSDLKLSIVIPSYNRRVRLNNLLYQIRLQQTSGISITTIVVIDGSTDGTYEMLKDNHPAVKVIRGTGDWWFTRSLNEGFKAALKQGADYVLILNDDCEIKYNYVQTIINDLNTLPSGAILGSSTYSVENPDILTFSGIRKINWLRLKKYRYHAPFYHTQGQLLEGIRQTKFLNARGTIVSSATLCELNLYDEYFPQYLSDSDFSYRAVKKGIPLYISWNARVYDYVESTSKGAPYIRQSFIHYMKQFFNKVSPNYLLAQWEIINRNVPFLFRPVAFLFYIGGTTKAYFKYRKIRSNG